MIFPVILSGGSGSRLWPLSQPARPKQFAPLMSGRSMICETAARFGDKSTYAAPVIVGAAAHKALLTHEAALFPSPAKTIILEPVARNTAPAIAAAALTIAQAHGEDALMLVLPADHAIAKPDAFHEAITIAAQAASNGALVTFGIVPTEPHTGYGYIREGKQLDGIDGVYEIAAFVEKPDIEKAKTYLASGDYAWNSGMFLFRAGSLLAEINTHHPAIIEKVSAAIDGATHDGACITLCPDAFGASDAISIDYAVMECTREGAVVPADLGWSDIGSWTALDSFADRDGDGNAQAGHAAPFMQDTKNCFISSTSDRPIAVIGASDLIIVDTPDGLLVVHKDHAQSVKDAAEHFRK